MLVTTGSIALFGIKGGIFTILTGGNHLVWGPPSSVIEGNNELAVALIIVVPLLYFMLMKSQPDQTASPSGQASPKSSRVPGSISPLCCA